jgi:hypothetical protein
MPKLEFKLDPARERMLQWRTDDPERWAMLQPSMRAVLEQYERARDDAGDRRDRRTAALSGLATSESSKKETQPWPN